MLACVCMRSVAFVFAVAGLLLAVASLYFQCWSFDNVRFFGCCLIVVACRRSLVWFLSRGCRLHEWSLAFVFAGADLVLAVACLRFDDQLPWRPLAYLCGLLSHDGVRGRLSSHSPMWLQSHVVTVACSHLGDCFPSSRGRLLVSSWWLSLALASSAS